MPSRWHALICGRSGWLWRAGYCFALGNRSSLSTRPSTFFIVPFRNRAGATAEGRQQVGRAVKYQASDVAQPLAEVAGRGRVTDSRTRFRR